MAKAKFQKGDIVKVKNVSWMTAKYRGLVTEISGIDKGRVFITSRRVISRIYRLKKIGYEREFKASDLNKTTEREAFLYHLHGPGKY